MAIHTQHVDSGWSWIILAANTLIKIQWHGLLKALSVLLPTLKDQFETHTWVIGVMVTTMYNVRDFAAPVTGVLASTISSRLLGIIGGLLVGSSLILASFADDLLVLWFVLAFVTGIGYSLVMPTSYALLAQYFDRYYPLASGVSASGAAVGLMIFAPVAQIFLTAYGWRNTLLLIGATQLHIVLCAALFRKPPVTIEESTSSSSGDLHLSYSFPEDENCAENHEEFGWMSESRSSGKRLNKFLELSGISLMTNRSFVVLAFSMATIAATYTAWVIYFIPHCLAKGITPHDASLLGLGTGIVYFIGHLIYIPFISKELYTVRVGIYISGTLAVIGLFVDQFANSITTIFISNAVLVLGLGAVFPLCDIFMKAVVEPDMLAKAFGWRMAINAIIRYLPSFLVGWIFDSTGSYNIGFMFLGVVQAAGILAMTIDHLCNKKDKTNKTNGKLPDETFQLLEK